MEEFRIETDGRALPSHGRYGAGEAQCPDRSHGRPQQRIHAFACLGVVVSGRFEFRTPRGATQAAAGSIVFGNAGEEFTYRYFDRDGARRAVVALDQDLMMEVAEHCGCNAPAFTVAALTPQRATAPLYALARKIAAARQPLEEDVLQMVAAALSIGRTLRPQPLGACERRRVHEVACYIDRCFALPLALADMAAMARLSKFHFLRAFRAVTGESPGRYLVAARLRAAVDRLLETRDPITTIALDVGFNDISHFNSTFRDAFGASPRAWRAGSR